MTGATPIAKQFMYGLILGAQDITIAYLTVRNAIRDAIPSSFLPKIGELNLAVNAGRIAVYGLAGGVALLGAAMAAAAIPLALPVVAIGAVVAAVYGAVEEVKEFGPRLIDGLVDGIRSGIKRAVSAARDLAQGVKNAFAGALQIHSPSRVFAEYGRQTAAGYEQGVEGGSDGTQSAVVGMTGSGRTSAPRAARDSGASMPSIQITINASGGDAKEIAAAVSSPDVLERITSEIIQALRSAGTPIPA